MSSLIYKPRMVALLLKLNSKQVQMLFSPVAASICKLYSTSSSSQSNGGSAATPVICCGKSWKSWKSCWKSLAS